MPSLLRLIVLSLACAVLLFQPLAQAQAPRRVALLIGNANYAVGPLRNPPQDVRVMADALKALGFQTQELLNANQNQMKRAVRDFGNQAQGADVAFLYYSGHGTQVAGENYLIPLQATIEKESDYEVEAVSANALMRQIAGARPKAAVVVLDACRDNPFVALTRSSAKGLSRMEAPTGTLIAFATAPYTTASDEGFYARVLARELRRPGSELLDVFRDTTAEVLRLSQGRQEPRVSEVSLTTRLYLAGAPGGGGRVANAAAEPVIPALDLGDLHQQAERDRRDAATLTRMQADFDRVAGFSGAASLQASAWDRFLAAWTDDKLPGRAGQDLQAQARQRLAAARRDAQPAVALQSAPSTALGPLSAADGTLRKIKDTGGVVMGVREASGALSFALGDGRYTGYHVELCERVIADLRKRLNTRIEVRYQPVTSANRLPLVQNGTVDLECGSTTNNQARQRDAAFAVTTFVEEVRMAVKASSGITSIGQLQGRSVVATTGTTSVQILRRHESAAGLDFKDVFGKDHADSFQLLESGRADAFVMDGSILARNIAASRSPAEYRITGEVLSVEPIAIMMRKDDPAFKQAVDDSLKAMMRSGELARIYDKWFQQPIPPGNLRINLPLSASLREAWANPNDRPLEEYAKR